MAIIYEENMDLFDVPQGWWLAHCVSADFEMGAGIAKEFRKRYDGAQEYLRSVLPLECKISNEMSAVLNYSNVFFMVTKQKYFHKPTYQSLQNALECLVRSCRQLRVKKLAMPCIGCGLDKLDWEKVKPMIENTFKDEHIKILICKR